MFQLTLLRHIERPAFYFYAVTVAALIVYAVWKNITIMLFLAWVPFIFYVAFGIFGAWRYSRESNNPLLLPTHYEVTDQGLSLKTSIATSFLEWKHIRSVKIVIDCYIFSLTSRQILAIPRADIAANHKEAFEEMVRAKLGQKM